MKLIRNYSFTAEDFFSYLEMKILEDIEKNTGVKQTALQQNFKYKTVNPQSNLETTITINKLKKNEYYQATYTYFSETATISYSLKNIPEGVQIIYQQNIKSYTSSNHCKIISLIIELFYYRKMQDNLSTIANAVLHSSNYIAK